jgi:hypothetical protein
MAALSTAFEPALLKAEGEGLSPPLETQRLSAQTVNLTLPQ